MSSRLRIVHAATFVHPDRTGGAERVVADLAAGQAELGHDVTVISCAATGAPNHEARRGFTHVRCPLDPALRGLAFLRAVRTSIRAAVLRQPAFDVLHTHQIASAAAAQSACRARHRAARRVHSFYAPYADESAVERGASWTQTVRAGVSRWLDRRTLARADTILVLSEFSRGQVAALAPRCLSRVHEVHPGVDTTRFFTDSRAAAEQRMRVPQGARLVVSVRRLVKRMGLDAGIDAFAAVAHEDARARYWIAGDGPERDALERRVRELGLEGRVRLLGRVAEDDLPDLLRAAHVFLLPTRALEGFGMATLEALACGTGVVATDAGASPAVLARLAPEFTPVPCDAAALARALRERLADPARTDAIAARAARTIAREHSLRAAAKSVDDAIQASRRPA
ncbi:MAG: glycosyltransferase family 4 protein [Planctomycetes bacterium]|nr:glycosyltransferase family 4 protein [Planctomycetota bacterium]MCC7171281.1 glycosyltransferase family 4 protein [Planctomycetota bacterium]